MKNPENVTRPLVAGRMRRLVRCCRVLGLWLGYRYWRLQNKAIRDPDIVLQWIEAWEVGAKGAELEGDYVFAGCLRGMIRECEEIRRKHSPYKELRYTGHVPCRKCGKVHWMYGNCPPNVSMHAPASRTEFDEQSQGDCGLRDMACSAFLSFGT